MPEVVIKIPDDLQEEFKGVKPIFWQLVVDRAINRELAMLNALKRKVSKSNLTEEDARKLSDEVSKALAKRYLELSKSKG